MPLYEYRCPKGHSQEKQVWRPSEAPEALPCPCGLGATRIISVPTFKFKQFSWEPPPVMSKGATMKDVWGDSPLGELEDGHNPLTYKSEKPFVDMGKEK